MTSEYNSPFSKAYIQSPIFAFSQCTFCCRRYSVKTLQRFILSSSCTSERLYNTESPCRISFTGSFFSNLTYTHPALTYMVWLYNGRILIIIIFFPVCHVINWITRSYFFSRSSLSF